MNIDELKREYPAGTRIELVNMDDPQAPPAGTRGTVQGVDDIGDILVKWDNGGGLNACPDVDTVRIISP